MTQSLPGSIEALAAHARSISGVKYAPDYPPDNIGVFPFSVIYIENGQIMAEAADQSRNIVRVIVEIHVSRVLLATAIETATGYIETYGDLLVNDPTLGGACAAIPMGISENITFEMGWLAWGGTPSFGVRFHVPVKIRRAV